MQDLEIMIRYKCEECGGSGAKRHEGSGKVIGNCSECGGQGKKQEWVDVTSLKHKGVFWSPF